MQDLKSKVLELASIAKECPENLQEKCFELLLSDFLIKNSPEFKRGNEKSSNSDTVDKKDIIQEVKEKVEDVKQEDIQEKDLHVKVKQFMKKETVTIEQLNQIYYKENEDLKPLYDDLKTTKASESQIRISLLNSLKNAMYSGDFKFNGEDVRKETQLRKCFDSANFAKIFKSNNSLFDNLEAYDKNNPIVSLSSEGKSRLAVIIKDLQ